MRRHKLLNVPEEGTRGKLFFLLAIVVLGLFFLYQNNPQIISSLFQKKDLPKEIALTPPTHNVDAENVLKENPQIIDCINQQKGREEKCINNFLKITSEQKGGRPALDLIEAASQKYPQLLVWSHPFAHTIGQHSLIYYEQFKDIPFESKIGRALVECDGFGAFGCYHGVVEIGLAKLPTEERSKVMRKACLEDPLITQKAYFVNQCSHWFGHAVAIFTNNTLLEALAMCDSLDPKWHADIVQLCLSGVFHAGLAPGGELIEDKTVKIDNVFKEGDPYYPCLDIPERYRSHCYSHAYGRTRNPDIAVQLQICKYIPESDSTKKRLYSGVCYDSVGNDVIEMSNFDPQIVVDNCRKYSSPNLRQYCYGGAARYWVLRNPLLENAKPLEVCKKAEEEAKPVCYARAGFGNYENFYSEDILKKFCGMGEEAYRQFCQTRSAPEDFTKIYVESTKNTSEPFLEPNIVGMTESGFNPETLIVKVGTTVTFVNKDKVFHWPASNLHPTHTIYSEFDPKQPIEPGKNWSFTFEKNGEWSYHDHLSPLLTGKIVVIN